jgi:hypothetical protein
MKFWLFLSFIVLSFAGNSQNAVRQIDMAKIPQRKVRALIENQFGDNSMPNFSDLKATYKPGQDMKKYRVIESVYHLKESPDEVWNSYQATSPAQSWNGHMVSFGLLISKENNKVIYCDDSYFEGIDTGQVFYVNLKLMKGLYNLAVGLEIIDIDSINRSITFSYIKGGKSSGEQTIYFMPTRKGDTMIVHQTAFRSDSFLRDYYLYPYFHRKAINEFHKNMRKSLYTSAQVQIHH